MQFANYLSDMQAKFRIIMYIHVHAFYLGIIFVRVNLLLLCFFLYCNDLSIANKVEINIVFTPCFTPVYMHLIQKRNVTK